MKMVKAYKYRIYPNKTQSQKLNQTFGCVRFCWNKWVESFNNQEVNYQNSTELKSEFLFLNEVSAASLQQKQRDFLEYKKQYFSKKRKSKVGRCSFKSRKSRQAYRLPNQKFKIKDNKIRLEKIGWIKFDNHRSVPENVKLISITISKNTINQYFCSIAFEQEKEIQKSSNPSVGIDLGLKDLAVLSDGLVFENPKFFSENQAELRVAQKHLSRKVKGSNRWNKQRIKVAKIHQKIANRRSWHLHNVTTYISDNYSDIGLEDLHIKGMVKNRKLSKSVSDTSMRTFRNLLTYKAKERGNDVVLLNRFEPSTKECFSCGNIQDMKLSDRIFKCTCCGFVMDRDLNAAKNIEKKTVGVNAVSRSWMDCKPNLHPTIGCRFVDLDEVSNVYL